MMRVNTSKIQSTPEYGSGEHPEAAEGIISGFFYVVDRESIVYNTMNVSRQEIIYMEIRGDYHYSNPCLDYLLRSYHKICSPVMFTTMVLAIVCGYVGLKIHTGNLDLPRDFTGS